MADPLDFFDEQKALGELRGKLEATNKTRRVSEGEIYGAQSDIESANNAFMKALEGMQPIYDKEIADTQKVLDNLDRIDSEGILADLKGIIMPSYNEETQMKALKRQSVQLDLLANRTSNLRQIHSQRVAADMQRIENAERIYQFNREQFLDSAKLAQLGFQLDEQIHQKLVQSLEDQPLANLDAWRKGENLDKLPESIKALSPDTQAGLVELVWLNKKGIQANLTSTTLSNTLQQENVRRVDVQNRLQALNVQQLTSIKLGKRKPPEGLTNEDINGELARREERDLALEAARLANAANSFNLQAAQQAKFLSTHTTAELSELVTQAENAPGKTIKINNVPFTYQMLVDAQNVQVAEDRKVQQGIHERILGSQQAQQSVQELRGMVEHVLKADNPDMDTTGMPLETMLRMFPAEEQGKLNTSLRKYETAITLGDAELVNKTAEEMGTIITGYQEKVIERTPDERKGGMREYTQTGDIRDRKNIVDWLASSDSPYLLGDLPVWGSAYKQFNTKLQDNKNRKDTGIQIGQDEVGAATFATINQKFTNTEAVAKTLSDLNLQQAVRDGLFEQMLGQTLVQIMAPTEAGGNVYAELMPNFVNPRTGGLGPMFYADDGAGGTVFSYRQTAQILAAAETKGHMNGSLMPNESLYSYILDQLNKNIKPYIAGQEQQSPDYKAFKNALFPTGITYDMAAAVGNLEVYEQEAKLLIQEQTTQLENEIEAATRLEQEIQGISPTFDPLDPQGGLRRRLLKQRQQSEQTRKTQQPNTFENMIRNIIGGS